ncbi:MAG: tetratricopeptide repeat protein [Gemmatimonadaceae bacterium]
MTHPPERIQVASAARTHIERGFRFENAGTLDRALDEYRAALDASPTLSEQAEAHLGTARVHRTLSDWAESHREAQIAIRIADRIPNDDLVAEAMNVEVGTLQVQGEFDQADKLAHEAIKRAKSPRVRGITLQNLGRSAAERREFDTSDRYFEQSIAAFREGNYELGLAIALTNAAKAALDRGNPQRSIEIGVEAIGLARRLNALDVLLSTVQNQAAALVAIGDLQSAEDLLTEALGHFTSARNLVRQAECLEIMGDISVRRGDNETAARCYARAADLAIGGGDAPLIERLHRRVTPQKK